MRFSKLALGGFTAACAILVAAIPASANHGKVGLWKITITMPHGIMGGGMDMSKLPPQVRARMAAAGMSGNTMSVEHCMTATEVAANMPHVDRPHGKSQCKPTNLKVSGNTMSTDMVCTGDFVATGHSQFTYDSDTHYSGEIKMKGTAHGHAIDQDEKIEGRWVSASCGSVTH